MTWKGTSLPKATQLPIFEKFHRLGSGLCCWLPLKRASISSKKGDLGLL